MDQERLVSTLTTGSKVTLEVILKAVWLAIKEHREQKALKAQTKIPTGKTSWKKMMASAGDKEVLTFMKEEINLKELKKELARLNVGFAYYKYGNGQVKMVFNAKDDKVVEDAMERLLDKIKEKEGDLKNNLKKGYRNMSATEKAEYLKKQQDLKVKIKSVDKVFEKASEKMADMGGKAK